MLKVPLFFAAEDMQEPAAQLRVSLRIGGCLMHSCETRPESAGSKDSPFGV